MHNRKATQCLEPWVAHEEMAIKREQAGDLHMHTRAAAAQRVGIAFYAAHRTPH